MTGVELIVAAIAAGSSAGVANTAATATDAHIGRTEILQRRLAGNSEAQEANGRLRPPRPSSHASTSVSPASPARAISRQRGRSDGSRSGAET